MELKLAFGAEMVVVICETEIHAINNNFFSVHKPHRKLQSMQVALHQNRGHHKMEQDETQKQINMPVIQRLDRLDLLLNYIEAEKNLPVPTAEIDHQCDRDLATVLEEIPVKGSLIERVASLEQRVLKLTQELQQERLESFGKLAFCSSLEEKLPESKQSTQIQESNVVSTEDKDLEDKEKQMHELDGKKEHRKGKRRINPNSKYRKWLLSIPTRC